MSFEKSEIMNEFLRIAEKQDMLGLKKTASPEKNPHQEDLKTIEEKRLKSPEKSIIEEAHPEPVYIAEARGDGGLVENQIEQQKKLLEMINKMPTGSLVGRYASVMVGLVKMAEDLDDVDELDVSDVLTSLASEFMKLAGRQLDLFTDNSIKESKLVFPNGMTEYSITGDNGSVSARKSYYGLKNKYDNDYTIAMHHVLGNPYNLNERSCHLNGKCYADVMGGTFDLGPETDPNFENTVYNTLRKYYKDLYVPDENEENEEGGEANHPFDKAPKND